MSNESGPPKQRWNWSAATSRLRRFVRAELWTLLRERVGGVSRATADSKKAAQAESMADRARAAIRHLRCARRVGRLYGAELIFAMLQRLTAVRSPEVAAATCDAGMPPT